MSLTPPPIGPGDVLAGKYRVERVLGAGAVGLVVSAVHLELAERRAIKVMLPGTFGEPNASERFVREARAASRLKSQHVVKIYDVGRFENGAPYIVMEHLEGTDLKTLLDERSRLSVDEAVRYVIQAASALAEAHALGIVHRDIKPANLFLTTVEGRPCVKVLDFGIAKIPGAPAPGEMEMTRTTDLFGTPLYMSPEQMRSTRDVDARTDVWSLGVLLYRMLTGRTPFAGETVTEICFAVATDCPDPLSTLRTDLPPVLDGIVMRCLEKPRAKRYENAAELGAALSAFLAQAAPSTSTFTPEPAEVAKGVGTLSGPLASNEHGTARASTWTRSEELYAAPPRSRAAAWLLTVGAVLVTFGVLVAGLWPRLNPRDAVPDAAVAPLSGPSFLPTAPSPEPDAPAPASSSASPSEPEPPPAPTVAPAPSAEGRPNAPHRASPGPPVRAPGRKDKRPDAFGHGRK